VKRKPPRKRGKKKEGQGPKSRQANSPKEAGNKEVVEPLILLLSVGKCCSNTLIFYIGKVLC